MTRSHPLSFLLPLIAIIVGGSAVLAGLITFGVYAHRRRSMAWPIAGEASSSLGVDDE